MKRTIGYILFILSWLAWGIIALLPFFELTMGQIASFTAVLLIIGEVTFWLSILLLGKEFIVKTKIIFRKIKEYLLKLITR